MIWYNLSLSTLPLFVDFAFFYCVVVVILPVAVPPDAAAQEPIAYHSAPAAFHPLNFLKLDQKYFLTIAIGMPTPLWPPTVPTADFYDLFCQHLIDLYAKMCFPKNLPPLHWKLVHILDLAGEPADNLLAIVHFWSRFVPPFPPQKHDY